MVWRAVVIFARLLRATRSAARRGRSSLPFPLIVPPFIHGPLLLHSRWLDLGPIPPAHRHTAIAPMAIITDGLGIFMNQPRAHHLNQWTLVPYANRYGVTYYVTSWGRVIGAYVNKDYVEGATHYTNIPVFMPFADGIIRTEASDHDDAGTIREGLCFSLRGATNSNCFPPW
jgi:hypothetical protein